MRITNSVGRPAQSVTKKAFGFRLYPKHLKLIKDLAEQQGISQNKLMLKAFLQYRKRGNKV